MHADSVMVFAAGFGTRMRDLTRDRPKPLLKVQGRTLLDRTLELATDAGIAHQVVNAHYHAAQIEAHLAGTDVAVRIEEPDILDTGGGLKAALPLIGPGPVFTANPDVVWNGPNPFAVLRENADMDADAIVLLVDASNVRGRVAVQDFAMSASGVVTRRGNWQYPGIQIIRSEVVAEFPGRVFSLNAVWDKLIDQGRLRGVAYPGLWCDVGTPEGLNAAEEMLSDA